MEVEQNTQEQMIAETTLSRQQLAKRWSCSVETIKRKEKEGLIAPLRLGSLSDIERVEFESL